MNDDWIEKKIAVTMQNTHKHTNIEHTLASLLTSTYSNDYDNDSEWKADETGEMRLEMPILCFSPSFRWWATYLYWYVVLTMAGLLMTHNIQLKLMIHTTCST